jgi:hypothetical protein
VSHKQYTSYDRFRNRTAADKAFFRDPVLALIETRKVNDVDPHAGSPTCWPRLPEYPSRIYELLPWNRKAVAEQRRHTAAYTF